MQTSRPNFSVEQVELIRRLRNSGITCEQLVDAFQALERIDATLGNTFNTPDHSTKQHARTMGAQSCGVHHSLNETAHSIPSGISSLSSGPISPRFAATDSLPVARSAAIADASQTLLTSSGTQSTSPVLSVPSFSDLLGSLRKEHSNRTQNQIRATSSAGPTRSHAADLTPDQCLSLVKCSSHDKVINLVKRCLMSADIKPLQQAQDLGVSESTMQAFLHGDVYSTDQSSCHKLLSWIISMCHHTDWFTLEMEKLLYFQGYGNGFDFQYSPRRERFTFRGSHLKVLEAFWRRKQYPTYGEKEQIAEECNCANAKEAERPLDDKEKVTHVHVANWFKNKRKEIKQDTKKGEISGDTVKTFLDHLNLKAARINSLGEDQYEETSLQQQSFVQFQMEKALSRSLSLDRTILPNPTISPVNSSVSGTGSTAFTTPSSAASSVPQVKVSNYSELAVSHPVLLFQNRNSVFTHTADASSSKDIIAPAPVTDPSACSQNQNSLQSVATLSLDCSNIPESTSAAATLPSAYPAVINNSGVADSSDSETDIDLVVNFEIANVKQEL